MRTTSYHISSAFATHEVILAGRFEYAKQMNYHAVSLILVLILHEVVVCRTKITKQWTKHEPTYLVFWAHLLHSSILRRRALQKVQCEMARRIKKLNK